MAFTACGSPGYVAPEIIEGHGYTFQVDYWSIGVILYILLCGFPPFFADTNQALFEQIMVCKYEFTSPYFDDISSMAKELISGLLVKDPKKRLTADEILEHTWMQGIVTPRTYLPNVTLQIKEFNTRRKFKRATYMVMAA